MFAMKLPKKLAVIKVKAHLTINTTEAKGNSLADVAAKQACFYATVQVCSRSTAQKTILPPESMILFPDGDCQIALIQIKVHISQDR